MVGLACDYMESSQRYALNLGETFSACGSLQGCSSFLGNNLLM